MPLGAGIMQKFRLEERCHQQYFNAEQPKGEPDKSGPPGRGEGWIGESAGELDRVSDGIPKYAPVNACFRFGRISG